MTQMHIAYVSAVISGVAFAYAFVSWISRVLGEGSWLCFVYLVVPGLIVSLLTMFFATISELYAVEYDPLLQIELDIKDMPVSQAVARCFEDRSTWRRCV